VAVDVLRSGGNAVDAAVSAAFVQGVTDPLMCGLGGYGVMLVHDAASRTETVVDFFSRAPAGVREGSYGKALLREFDYDYGYVLDDGSNEIGYQSIGIPGTVAGLALALERFGTIDWQAAVEHAARVADAGLAVTPAMHQHWQATEGPDKPATLDRLTASEGARAMFLRDGRPLRTGEVIDCTDYASTLRRLAAAGAADFYRGGIAAAISEDFAANGALVTGDDLAAYEPAIVTPLTGSYRGLGLVVPPFPSGGLTMLEALNVLELEFGGKLPEWPSTAAISAVARALGRAVQDKMRYLAGPREDGAEPPVEMLISKEHARRIHDGGPGPVTAAPTLAGTDSEAADTTHIVVVDGAGNAVSLTHTLASGSGVITPGLGFMYNDFMHGFDPRPGRWNSLRPHATRPASNCPTFVKDDDGRLVAVAGATGSTRIVSSLVQVLSHFIDRGWDPDRVLSAARINCQRGSLIQMEARVASSEVAGLTAEGWRVERHLGNYEPYFGRAYLLCRNGDDDWHGAADPRGGGGVVLVA
jgi:gamma-glutamyltranspeptidase/glutathione hydrolase